LETISPVYARLILRDLEQHGIDPAPLFQGTGLTRESLLRGGDIALNAFLHALQVGRALSPDGKLGFMLGRNMHIFALGSLGAGMAVAPTVREGLQLAESYSLLHVSYIDIRLRSSLQGITLDIHYQQDTGELERFHTETAMMLFQHYLETTIGEQLHTASYHMAYPEPENRADYDQAFHGRLYFGAHNNRVELPRQTVDLPSPYFHQELWRQAQLSLSQRLKQLGETEGTAYSRYLRAVFRSSEPPLPDLSQVAASLHVSERTLNRRLQGEQTSFRTLKSAALAEWAKLYLGQTNDSVEAIAATLGYKDTANFRRAFRKSEHCSPNDYRQKTKSK
jgi:AraC-like DNA-binding protein